MKTLLATLFMAIAVYANAQTVKDNHIIMGNTDSVNSKILQEKRKIWVHVPDGSNNLYYTQQHYPVVYLLDGDAHFASVTGMIQQLSEVNGNMICPDMIVVGIPNTDRTRDLTPTKSLFGPDGKKIQAFAGSGGGEKFAAFIEKELIPHIDSIYPTAPYKVLIGHSFGGLTVMNILVNHTNLFNSYIAIDPSMWWDGRKLLKQAREALQQKSFQGKSLFLAIANTMPAGMDTLKAWQDTSGNTAHIRSILELAKELRSNQINGLKFAYKYYDKDNHGSVPLIAEYDAIRFLFSYYNMPQSESSKLFDPKAKIDVAALFATHYDDVSKYMGYKVMPPEQMVNELGYAYLGSNMSDRAFALFNLNVHNYPQSFNVYDSMGDYYNMKGDKTKTIEFYTKALQLKDNPETREKLKRAQQSQAQQ